MDTTSREDLSALMDGELAAEPTRFMLRRLEHDPELIATWSRWHLIRACLASDSARISTAKAGGGFARRVADAVAARTALRHRWMRFAGGGAVAAGVAIAALVLSVPQSADVRTTAEAVTATDTAPGRPAAAPALASMRGKLATVPAPWLLERQPTVLGAQPASANAAFGTGLLQADYLRPATYARDASLMAFPSALPDDGSVPYAIRMAPQRRPSSPRPQQH
jgi:sigma-E factor negative regulatory protein RseA